VTSRCRGNVSWVSHKDVNERKKERMNEGKNEVPLDSGQNEILSTLCRNDRIQEFYFEDMPCVYLLADDSEVVYVGRTEKLWQRLTGHMNNKKFDRVYYIPTPRQMAQSVEGKLIRRLNPKYNKAGKGGEQAPSAKDLKSIMKDVLHDVEIQWELYRWLLADNGIPCGI